MLKWGAKITNLLMKTKKEINNLFNLHIPLKGHLSPMTEINSET
jgi:hypothetical protein